MDDSSVWQIALADEAATLAAGRQLASGLGGGMVITLYGDLGAGKTTLTRGVLAGLGHVGRVRSPTYTLVERYPLPAGGEAWHLDLYRIGNAGELDFLGLDEDEAALWLVEWPERGAGALPPLDLHVALEMQGDGRKACLQAHSPAGRA